MAGIIRWLAPHMGFTPQNPVDAGANAAGNWAMSGAPGSPSAANAGGSPLVNATGWPTGGTPQQPATLQQALHDAWNRYVPPHMALPAGIGSPPVTPPLSGTGMRPTPQAHGLPPPHPASVTHTIEYHKPEPPEHPDMRFMPNQGSAANPPSIPGLYFLHPGVGQSGAANAAPITPGP